ncbi:uncharacterized protein LOC120274767 [Dioscorea cayenensis subsp. rotundata]|uniref:Uncharacterized protein LOC120274767 n=1 Tax=Dioscorea cayennensis subsp. rotundata TaxID=55577 RepID=A0AB40CFZ4_DIOCR|nr:uncharacterized protein LOC120274767 [Dioscorea cayenensis subsp. rotundata]
MTPPATATIVPICNDPKPPSQRRGPCFSFAAYTKAVVEYLRVLRVPIANGLSDPEFAAIESTLGFKFPPDLRSILSEGLPIGPGFPNWRAASPQQLQVLLTLPVSGLLHEISKGSFWPNSWGLKPVNPKDSISMARSLLEPAPVLVPIYRHFYIPSLPNLAGNPVFLVHAGEVRVAGIDLADFLQREAASFSPKETIDRGSSPTTLLPTPAWAAKEARRVEVWTDLAGARAEKGDRTWEMEGWMKELRWRLREGGWREEEVREMMDGDDESGKGDRMVLRDRESVLWHVRLLALALLRAGWSSEDVAYAMGEARKSSAGP